MTNQQLAILLRAYRERLSAEIAYLDMELGPDVDRHTTPRYIGESKSLLTHSMDEIMRDIAAGPKPEDFEDIVGMAMMLDGLVRLEQELEEAINDLLAHDGNPIPHNLQDFAAS